MWFTSDPVGDRARPWPLLAVVTSALILIAAACGSDDSSTAGTAEAAPEQSATVDPTPDDATADTPAPEDPTPDPPTPEAPTPEGASGDPAPTDTDVTFSEHIEPIVATTCARCHTGDGPGTPHLRLDTAADVSSAATGILTLVETQTMPPWPASAQSVPFLGDLSLSEDEIASLANWAAAGAPLDVDEATEMVPTDGVFRLADPDAVLTPARGYDGAIDDPDQYRCLVYDPEVVEPTWITGYEFVPDQTEVVHHAIGYVLPEQARTLADRKEAQDDEPGWECFGSSGLGSDEIFLGWAPGQGPIELPDGSGLRLEPGDFLVIQIHYHFEVEAPADSSAMLLTFVDGSEDLDEVVIEEYLAPAEIPCLPEEEGPLCDRDASIARAIERYGREGVQADFVNNFCGADPEDFELVGGLVGSSCVLPVRTAGTIVSILGHEHEIGSTFRMTLNPGRSDEVVLLDIPRWDFDWQYNYYPVDEIEVAPGDEVMVECSWDRLLRDPDLEPAWVMWADGTDDEMCFATIAIRQT